MQVIMHIPSSVARIAAYTESPVRPSSYSVNDSDFLECPPNLLDLEILEIDFCTRLIGAIQVFGLASSTAILFTSAFQLCNSQMAPSALGFVGNTV